MTTTDDAPSPSSRPLGLYATFAQMLDDLCTSKGFFQHSQVAHAIGSANSEKDIGNWRSGRNLPSPGFLKPLADALGVTGNPELEQTWNRLYAEAAAARKELRTSAADQPPEDGAGAIKGPEPATAQPVTNAQIKATALSAEPVSSSAPPMKNPPRRARRWGRAIGAAATVVALLAGLWEIREPVMGFAQQVITLLSGGAKVADVGACDQLAKFPADTATPYRGRGIERAELQEDAGPAVAACQKSTETHPNELRFQFQLGRALLARGLSGRSSDASKDFSNARSWIGNAWANGYRAAGYHHAANLITGRGGLKDEAQGWRLLIDNFLPSGKRESWTSTAATAACGFLYYNQVKPAGMSQEDNDRAMFEYCDFAYQRDRDAVAAVTLGAMYFYGRGVAADPKKAFYFAQSAENTRIPGALYDLSFYYRTGTSAPRNLPKAAELMVKASAFAQKQTNSHHQPSDDDLCRMFFAETDAGGNLLGSVPSRPLGITKKQAVEACVRSAGAHREDQPHHHAGLYYLGRLKETGTGIAEGVDRNEPAAQQLYLRHIAAMKDPRDPPINARYLATALSVRLSKDTNALHAAQRAAMGEFASIAAIDPDVGAGQWGYAHAMIARTLLSMQMGSAQFRAPPAEQILAMLDKRRDADASVRAIYCWFGSEVLTHWRANRLEGVAALPPDWATRRERSIWEACESVSQNSDDFDHAAALRYGMMLFAGYAFPGITDLQSKGRGILTTVLSRPLAHRSYVDPHFGAWPLPTARWWGYAQPPELSDADLVSVRQMIR